MNYSWSKPKHSAWKGIVAGIAGGLAGAYAMGLFAELCTKTSEKVNDPRRHRELQRAAADAQDSTAKTADKILHPVLGRHLRSGERETAKPIVHYAFGSAVGALYGVAAEYTGVVRKFAGAPFGAAVCVGAHNVALPALNLTKKNGDYPLALHATEFGSHIVYGVTLEGVRRLARRILRA
jgi:putative membrane protein